MKRIIAIIGVLIIILSLTGCSGGKPEKTSDAMYQIGLNALQTADDYINGKITGDEAEEIIKNYSAQADAEYEKECKDHDEQSLVGTDASNDTSIMFAISTLSNNIFNANCKFKTEIGSVTMSDVRKAKEKLAKTLGK